MAIKFTSLTPTIQVDNLEDAIAFYEKLGFESQWVWPEDNPTHSSLKKDNISFMITLVDKEKEIQKGDLYFWVENATEYFQILKEKGIQVSKLIKTGYGMLDTSITDRWGHHLTFGEPSGDYEG